MYTKFECHHVNRDVSLTHDPGPDPYENMQQPELNNKYYWNKLKF